MKLNGIKVKIEGVLNPRNFLGCSFEERAGFQNIIVTVNTDMPGASDEEKESWLKETESRCPVTDNIKADTTINVVRE